MGVVSSLTKRRRGPDGLIDAVLTGGWSVPFDLLDSVDPRSRSQREAARLRRAAGLIDGLLAVVSTARPHGDGLVAIDSAACRHYTRELRRRRYPPGVRTAARRFGELIEAGTGGDSERLVPAGRLSGAAAALSDERPRAGRRP